MAKILIVDDNVTDVLNPLKRQFSRLFDPEEISEAVNGKIALEQIARNRPQVIILDVMMPVMDGITTCRAIRSDPKNHDIYIIMLTGRDGGLPEGLEVGADVYLHKPCAFDELLAMVQKGLEVATEHRTEMATRRTLEQQMGNLNENRWALQDIITSLSAGIILCAPHLPCPIRYMNPSAVRLTERTPETLQELAVTHLFPDPAFDHLLDRMLANAKPKSLPKTLRTGSGKNIEILLSGRVICDSRGEEKWLMLELIPRYGTDHQTSTPHLHNP